MKLDVLAMGAHPDDVELGCGGVLAKEVSKGKRVGILDLTRGESGTRGTPEVRLQEAQKAAAILGVSVRENLGLPDAFLENSPAFQRKLIPVIRKYRPEVVLLNAIADRHPDHGKASELASDSCFLSGLWKIATDCEGRSQKAWRPKRVYHYIQGRDIPPDFLVDITGFMEVKLESIRAHASQFYNPDSKEPESPITHKDFFELLGFRARNWGRFAGVKYAEGYTVARYPCVESLFDLK
ncbi:MAG: bacillithiol biosynthesis deacetylase BshB1 [Flavobacteriales bacterium]